MDFRAKVTVLGILAAAFVGSWPVGHYAHPAVGAVFFLFVLFSGIAFVWIEDANRRPQLAALFAQRRWGQLYRHLLLHPRIGALARWPRDWRMYDWALRLAVAYPVLTAIAVWIGWGQTITLGSIEIIPAAKAHGSAPRCFLGLPLDSGRQCSVF